MCRKLIYIVCFVVMLGLNSSASADLVGHWNLNEGSGSIAHDLSGNGNDGTFVGNPQWIAGVKGGALEFDGESYVDCGNDDSLDITGPISIAIWIKPFVGDDVETAPLCKADSTLGWSWQLRYGWLSPVPYMGFQFNATGARVWVYVQQDLPLDEWYHITASHDGSTVKCYLDGEETDSASMTEFAGGPSHLLIGSDGWRDDWIGAVDEVRIYDHGLSIPEIIGIIEGEVPPYAFGPEPKDGALYTETWATLIWKPGPFAVSHDVYLGENFDDVNEATTESDVFRGNQGIEFLTVGIQGYPYPDGLVPGTTYYWRIDEVNEAEPNSPWKGPVWSFTIPPRKAYNLLPADGAFFIDPDVVLSWEAGLGARVHHLYFGEDYAEVEAGTGDTYKGFTGNTTYTPGTLELETTYYWRVDELDATATNTGDVLSFITASAGGGLRGNYYRGRDLSNLALTRVDPQIDFNWGENAPDEVVGENNFSVRWSGEIGAQYSETYTFFTTSDDGVRLWVGGQLLIDNWTDHGSTEDKGTIDLVGGNYYSIVMEMYDNTGSATAQLRWESPHTPKQLIPSYVLSLPIKAGSPSPSNGSVDVKQNVVLEWAAGENAASHEVYFGTDAEAVRNATSSSPEFKGTRTLGSESYDPGPLQWDTTYYWRVDEINNVNPDSPWPGNFWSFTTANFLSVDDFEDYNDYAPDRIFDVWIDGYGTATNGSTIGYADPDFTAGEHFVETTIVHSGNQSMPYFYDNTTARNSEATMTLVYPRNWTENGVITLTLWFIGDSTNSAELMYIVLDGSAVVYHDNADAALVSEWTEWNIELQKIADQGVNLADVDRIGIGFGDRSNPQAGGSGTVFFDDIRLYKPVP